MTRALIIALSLIVPLSARSARAESLSGSCPEYAAQLQRARTALAQDDRAGAIVALREAQAALTACEEMDTGEAGDVAPVAASPASPLDRSVGLFGVA